MPQARAGKPVSRLRSLRRHVLVLELRLGHRLDLAARAAVGAADRLLDQGFHLPDGPFPTALFGKLDAAVDAVLNFLTPLQRLLGRRDELLGIAGNVDDVAPLLDDV